MLRRLVLAAALLPLAACSHTMDDREYCTRRQMAWEMAFPNLPQTDSTRSSYIDACVANVAQAHDNGELARSKDCMAKHLVGKGHAAEQWEAFEKCEVVDPSRER